MNPAIAALSERFAVLGEDDQPRATYATFDSEGVYRLYVLTIQRLEWWAMGEWERQGVSHQGWWYDDEWNRVAA